MAVAKSYQSMTQEGKPFLSNGRYYVLVRDPKNGNVRQVRWYSDAEYARLYPESKPQATKKVGTQRDALGFQAGFITIFRGDTYKELDFFRQSNARYATHWGWYVVSTEEVPANLPPEIEAVRLPWESVGTEAGVLKSDGEVKRAVEALLYPVSADEPSSWQGEVGKSLTIEATVLSTFDYDSAYGTATKHIMVDADGNQYTWTTTAKHWAVDSVHHLRGTVKAHDTYHNVPQTVLTRCREV